MISFDHRRIREKYEAELREVERSERNTLEKFNSMKVGVYTGSSTVCVFVGFSCDVIEYKRKYSSSHVGAVFSLGLFRLGLSGVGSRKPFCTTWFEYQL